MHYSYCPHWKYDIVSEPGRGGGGGGIRHGLGGCILNKQLFMSKVVLAMAEGGYTSLLSYTGKGIASLNCRHHLTYLAKVVKQWNLDQIMQGQGISASTTGCMSNHNIELCILTCSVGNWSDCLSPNAVHVRGGGKQHSKVHASSHRN